MFMAIFAIYCNTLTKQSPTTIKPLPTTKSTTTVKPIRTSIKPTTATTATTKTTKPTTATKATTTTTKPAKSGTQYTMTIRRNETKAEQMIRTGKLNELMEMIKLATVGQEPLTDLFDTTYIGSITVGTPGKVTFYLNFEKLIEYVLKKLDKRFLI
jgi:hypothetical protein